MKYAIIENNLCVNIIEASAEFAESMGAILLPDGYGIGDSYTDDTWAKAPQPEPEPLTEEEKKAIRDDKVREIMSTCYPNLTDEIGILYRGTAEEKALHEERYLAACAEADEYVSTL